jgi:regulatory protein
MDAYTTALTLLSRRELSVRQVRERLGRRKFGAHEIEQAIERLVADGTLDDRRVALAYARMQASIKGHGRRRVLQQVQQLGVSAEIAKGAVSDVFGEISEAALLDQAIHRRLKGASPATLDAKGKARVVRSLVSKGFEPSQVIARLRQKGADLDE